MSHLAAREQKTCKSVCSVCKSYILIETCWWQEPDRFSRARVPSGHPCWDSSPGNGDPPQAGADLVGWSSSSPSPAFLWTGFAGTKHSGSFLVSRGAWGLCGLRPLWGLREGPHSPALRARPLWAGDRGPGTRLRGHRDRAGAGGCRNGTESKPQAQGNVGDWLGGSHGKQGMGTSRQGSSTVGAGRQKICGEE